MRHCRKTVIAICLSLGLGAAHADDDNPGSGQCEKPVFSEFLPAANKYVQSFTEFSFKASANTIPDSIVVQINVANNQLTFTAKDLEIDRLPNGKLEIQGKLGRALEHGFARLNVRARSADDCESSTGYLLRVH